uniref:Uncharacterized protein n=1 Tax=Panagrolaimus davidi TaxID=227884 RepID=A0A914P7K9_9BILA
MKYLLLLKLSVITTFVLKLVDSELSDANSCLKDVKQGIKNELLTSLNGIVGVGWDDLMNEITLPIFATTFYKCKTTPDGHFLIPDNVLAVPIQEVFIDRSAKTTKYFGNAKSETVIFTRTKSFAEIVESGSFDVGKHNLKKIFSDGNIIMLEIGIDYKAFKFIAEEKADVDPSFLEKIDEIVESLKKGLPIFAKYQAECIIRDYGTHIVNKALTGASMKYKAFVTEDNVEIYDGGLTQLKTDAATYFLNLIIGNNKTQTELIDRGFFEKLENSFIETKGGLDVRLILGADKVRQSKILNKNSFQISERFIKNG